MTFLLIFIKGGEVGGSLLSWGRAVLARSRLDRWVEGGDVNRRHSRDREGTGLKGQQGELPSQTSKECHPTGRIRH